MFVPADASGKEGKEPKTEQGWFFLSQVILIIQYTCAFRCILHIIENVFFYGAIILFVAPAGTDALEIHVQLDSFFILLL